MSFTIVRARLTLQDSIHERQFLLASAYIVTFVEEIDSEGSMQMYSTYRSYTEIDSDFPTRGRELG